MALNTKNRLSDKISGSQNYVSSSYNFINDYTFYVDTIPYTNDFYIFHSLFSENADTEILPNVF